MATIITDDNIEIPIALDSRNDETPFNHHNPGWYAHSVDRPELQFFLSDADRSAFGEDEQGILRNRIGRWED